MKLTVFTPTYNRGYTIENAYQSLCRQTCKDFEWLVVDDGSTDDTKKLFEKWISLENEFPIRYYQVPNGGKMRAVNKGAQLAEGELFLNLDSDDYLTDDAVETVIFWEKTIRNEKESFAGVAGQKCHFDGTPIGSSFPSEYLDASVLERNQYGIKGDKAEIFYTDLLRKHPFPEFDGEKFIAEGITWMAICHEEKKVLRWFNKPIIKCEYFNDGYSANSWQLSVKNPQGILYNCKKEIEITNPSYMQKMKLWHKYYLVAKYLGYNSKAIRNNLEISVFDFVILSVGDRIARLKNSGLECYAK